MKINKNSIYIILTGSLFLFPILNIPLRNALISVWAIYCVFYIVYPKCNFLYKKTFSERLILFLCILYFLLIIISLLYTDNFQQGFSSLEKSFTIFLLPLLIYLAPYRFDYKIINLFANTFIASTFIFLTYTATLFIFKYNPNFQWENTEIATGHLRYVLSNEIVSVHPTYQALWFFFAALCCFYFVFLEKRTKQVHRYFYIVLFLILIFWGTVLASRTPFIAFFITICLITLTCDHIPKSAKTFIVLTLAAGVLILSTLPTVQLRVKEVFNTELVVPKGDEFNSVNLRVGIFNCSASAIKKNWLFGVGVGDVQDELNTCYDTYDTEAFKEFDYGTHNQYLHSWLAGGLAELLCLAAILLGCYIIALKYKYYLLLGFVPYISICFLTESILERNDGMLIFITLISVVGIGATKEDRIEEAKI